MTEQIPSCNGAGEMPGREGALLYDEELIDEYYSSLNEQEVNKMVSLKDSAMAFEPKQTLNIADLESVPINDLQIQERKGIDKDGVDFDYNVVEKDGKEYRVPNSVLEEVQKIIKLKPSVTRIKVIKTGTGLGTRYKVNALD